MRSASSAQSARRVGRAASGVRKIHSDEITALAFSGTGLVEIPRDQRKLGAPESGRSSLLVVLIRHVRRGLQVLTWLFCARGISRVGARSVTRPSSAAPSTLPDKLAVDQSSRPFGAAEVTTAVTHPL